jgi:hypothetical protein
MKIMNSMKGEDYEQYEERKLWTICIVKIMNSMKSENYEQSEGKDYEH